MRLATAGLAALIGLSFSPAALLAQSLHSSLQNEPSISVPRIIGVSGEFRPADGRQPFPFETATFRIYADDKGGVPLWEETQTLAIDASGRYSVLLGSTQKEGVPVDAFLTGEARWLGITWSRIGEVEGARSQITSVPYALRAADAETLGGLPATAFLRAPAAGGGFEPTNKAAGGPGSTTQNTTPSVVLAGTQNFMAKYVSSTDIGESALYELNGLFGFNTNAPRDIIHSRFTNDDGQLTGIAVQNIGSGYSGMAFYDQFGALAQFQGFNNTTHEYRINNIASSGSVNFMLGGNSKLKVHSDGEVMIGTTVPDTSSFTMVSNLLVRQAAFKSGIGVRKPASDTFAAGIHVRSGPAVTGALMKAIQGGGDSSDWGSTDSAVLGVNNNPNSVAVEGWSTNVTGGVGIWGHGGQFAGKFTGDVTVSGVLTKGGGAFQIDHPLDPANKYLMHSFVESPDMMNVYNGNVALDGQGEAYVMLPEWFESLNRDFRYQLTAVGGPGPYLHVAEEITGNRFKISGGSPGGKVSWQVTGIRHDAWADAHRIPTELAKAPDEVGKFLHAKELGLGEEKSIVSSRLREAVKRSAN